MAIDPVSVTTALTALNHAAAITKGLVGTVKAMGKAEVVSELVDLQTAILEIQQKQGELIAENQTLKEENRKLRQRADFRSVAKFNGSVYVVEGQGKEDGHFCPTCLDDKDKAIRLHRSDDFDPPTWTCKNCEDDFRVHPRK